MYYFLEDEFEQLQPDQDYLYDSMRDDFLLCDSVIEAKRLIKYYGVKLAKQFLPEQYLYLLEDN